jgi:hypothetical protein
MDTGIVAHRQQEHDLWKNRAQDIETVTKTSTQPGGSPPQRRRSAVIIAVDSALPGPTLCD